MNKKNEDLLQSIQRMEEKIKNLTRENVEMVSRWPPGTSPDTWSVRAPAAPGPLRARSPGPASHRLPRKPQELSQPTPIPAAVTCLEARVLGCLRPEESARESDSSLSPAICYPGALKTHLSLSLRLSFFTHEMGQKVSACRVIERMEWSHRRASQTVGSSWKLCVKVRAFAPSISHKG